MQIWQVSYSIVHRNNIFFGSVQIYCYYVQKNCLFWALCRNNTVQGQGCPVPVFPCRAIFGGVKKYCAGLRTTQCLNSTGSACPVALGHRGCIRAGDAQSTSLGSPGQVLPLYQRIINGTSVMNFGKICKMIFRKMRGGSNAGWKFSENSSVLEAWGFPY